MTNKELNISNNYPLECKTLVPPMWRITNNKYPILNTRQTHTSHGNPAIITNI